MPAVTTHAARYSILALDVGDDTVNVGVLLIDPETDRLYLRLRRDWDWVAPDEVEVLSDLEADLERKSAEMGAVRLIEHLEDTLSNMLRITDRRETVARDFERTLGRLYREHVPSHVAEYVT